MEDIGNVIFYIILGIIALAGSFQGKGKKKPSSFPGPAQNRPGSAASKPEGKSPSPAAGRMSQPAGSQVRRNEPSPRYVPSGPTVKRSYVEPMASGFDMEGEMDEPMAGAFSHEGSTLGGMAEAFANEGNIADPVASAFSTEGISSLAESSIGGFVHNEISDSEIGDAPDFDYDAASGQEIHGGGFNLKKAVIYSALLNRKEYSY
jgi:hypothetical protein